MFNLAGKIMSMTSFLGGIQNDPNFSERLERIEQKLDLLLEQKSDLYECVHSSDILDVVDVASICKVAPRTIYNWVYAGKLTCFKANGRLLFKRTEVEDFISRRKHRKI